MIDFQTKTYFQKLDPLLVNKENTPRPICIKYIISHIKIRAFHRFYRFDLPEDIMFEVSNDGFSLCCRQDANYVV